MVPVLDLQKWARNMFQHLYNIWCCISSKYHRALFRSNNLKEHSLYREQYSPFTSEEGNSRPSITWLLAPLTFRRGFTREQCRISNWRGQMSKCLFLRSDWNLKPIFTQIWASVDKLGLNPNPSPAIPTLPLNVIGFRHFTDYMTLLVWGRPHTN